MYFRTLRDLYRSLACARRAHVRRVREDSERGKKPIFSLFPSVVIAAAAAAVAISSVTSARAFCELRRSAVLIFN